MYVSFEPCEKLASFVECYWSWTVEPAPGELDAILPDAAPELIIHLGAPPFALNDRGEWVQQSRAFLYCAASRPLALSARSPIKIFAIRFRPWGVSRFSGGAMAELVDRAVSPEEGLGETGAHLANALASAESDSDRVRLADAILGKGLAAPSRYGKKLETLLDAAQGGIRSASEMADKLALSGRSFRRLWHDVVGIEPRKFIQLMRFHKALEMISNGESLGRVAADCGFSDQAHMARQIRSISGLSPSSLRKRLGNDVYKDLYTSRPDAPWREPGAEEAGH